MLTKTKTLIILGIVIILLGVLSLYFFWNPSDYDFFPKCPFYSMTGIFCPGCGSQRAAHQIINGNIVTGIRHNYLLLLLFLVLGYQVLLFAINSIYNKSFNNILHLPITTKIILVLVILFWVLRNIKLHPFTELAP
ncbi:DUF2752 domain-containing protein [Ichthyenterobacterium magnum]|uniref:Uncharacterized protein DUF2752 n=1 Tax=Ichthyenterobacterium magnum TaxID=1230530 RepID=A0A420DKM6_9FLAO|nr:DUF2752 domain-containing protein [Ichthyenterobacterium magnum]RKE94745.1 uncharacterized protein DUF2752 [Ichthyenterobacterium magnum]